MKHYLFEDEATGEEFIVGEYCLEKAYLEAKLYFDDHFEADKFISENEAAGNVITIIAPYYELVPMDEVPDIYKD